MAGLKPGSRVIRDDGLMATFVRPLHGGYGVFSYDDDNTPERVSRVEHFTPAPARTTDRGEG